MAQYNHESNLGISQDYRGLAVAAIILAVVLTAILFSGSPGTIGDRAPVVLVAGGSFVAGGVLAWLWRRRRARRSAPGISPGS
jgi:hypothetical protein